MFEQYFFILKAKVLKTDSRFNTNLILMSLKCMYLSIHILQIFHGRARCYIMAAFEFKARVYGNFSKVLATANEFTLCFT